MEVNKEELFRLSVEEFDDDESRVGWRLLAEDQGKDREAAELIEEYIGKVTDDDRLWFHAGQCWAYCGPEYVERTKDCFRHSLRNEENELWMNYKEASISFLNNNLQDIKDRLSRMKGIEDKERDVIVRVLEHMVAQLEEDGTPDYVKMYESLL